MASYSLDFGDDLTFFNSAQDLEEDDEILTTDEECSPPGDSNDAKLDGFPVAARKTYCRNCHKLKNPDGVLLSSLSVAQRKQYTHKCSRADVCTSFVSCGYLNGHPEEKNMKQLERQNQRKEKQRTKAEQKEKRKREVEERKQQAELKKKRAEDAHQAKRGMIVKANKQWQKYQEDHPELKAKDGPEYLQLLMNGLKECMSIPETKKDAETYIKPKMEPKLPTNSPPVIDLTTEEGINKEEEEISALQGELNKHKEQLQEAKKQLAKTTNVIEPLLAALPPYVDIDMILNFLKRRKINNN